MNRDSSIGALDGGRGRRATAASVATFDPLSGAPHDEQKRPASGTSAWQVAHRMDSDSSRVAASPAGQRLATGAAETFGQRFAALALPPPVQDALRP